jgi:hypothetical protein
MHSYENSRQCSAFVDNYKIWSDGMDESISCTTDAS